MIDRRTFNVLRRAVDRGVAVLDERRPSWFTKINTTKLDLGDCEICVLGQLYGTGDSDGYYRGLALLNGAIAKRPEKYGFNIDWDRGSPDEQFAIITALWRDEVAARRRSRREAKA